MTRVLGGPLGFCFPRVRLCGRYGTTRFLSSETFRIGQQSVVAVDTIALMDALQIGKAILGGFDWGARTADIIAALWPSAARRSSRSAVIRSAARKPAKCRYRHRLSSNGGTNIILPRNAAGPATTNTGTTLPSSFGSSLRRNGTSTIPRSIAAGYRGSRNLARNASFCTFPITLRGSSLTK